MLAVRDNGAGMSEDVKSHIFEPFFTTKEQGEGTGLGLSICYGIVTQQGGHIFVCSEPGKGTTLRIYLPRVDEAAVGRPQEDRSNLLPRGSEMVLLAEDEETVRGLSAKVLRGQGYTVLEAENGVEALRVAEQLDEDRIDLLLTDIVMPVMGGRELADRLRASQGATKVLYTSGYSDGAVFSQQRLETGTEFISKPFTPESLAQRVRETPDML